ncbi:MAG: Hsp20/alpha crystallin family protein [Bacteroidetes bacterium]|nr:Hsp20/alpha crystallin family protein [Bacteroidota bacterium]
MLPVSVEHKEEKEEKKKNYICEENSYNSFSRTFTLPENLKEDDVNTLYENGVLKLDIAKNTIALSKTKEISVV